jgi:DNA-directed RNA polymerase specialized sigma24 family protein
MRLLALDEVLARLAEEDPVAGRAVELRYFGGLGHEQVAAALDTSVYQARQKWSYARAWLSNFLDILQAPARDPSAAPWWELPGFFSAARLFAIFF